MTEHSNQGINTEAVDLSSDKVADPWLSHFTQVSRLRLRKAPSLNQPAEPNHQICPNLEILSFFLRESEVAEYIASGAPNFNGHCASFFFCRRTR